MLVVVHVVGVRIIQHAISATQKLQIQYLNITQIKQFATADATKVFHGVEQILNFFHVLLHLKAVPALAYGEGSGRDRIYHNKLEGTVLDRQAGNQSCHRINCLHRQLPRVLCVRKNRLLLIIRHHLRCVECTARNLNIGLGLVEAVINVQITQRMEISEMTWGEKVGWKSWISGP